MPSRSRLFPRSSPNSTNTLSVKERFIALKNIPEFLKLIWNTNAAMCMGNIVLRILKSAIVPAMLFITKLIIDEVIFLSQLEGERDLSYLIVLVALEFGLAIFSDLLNRGIALLDSLLGDLFSNQSSVRLMKHAAKLDLDQFKILIFMISWRELVNKHSVAQY